MPVANLGSGFAGSLEMFGWSGSYKRSGLGL